MAHYEPPHLDQNYLQIEYFLALKGNNSTSFLKFSIKIHMVNVTGTPNTDNTLSPVLKVQNSITVNRNFVGPGKQIDID